MTRLRSLRPRRELRRGSSTSAWLLGISWLAWFVVSAAAQPTLPELTQPVNDFAKVVDPASAAEMERQIRALDAATGDSVVVATVPSLEGYGGIEEYAVKLFENHGRGIGRKGRDNGLLIVVAPNERRIRIETGYDLEQWITDGYAGETIREFIAPEFRRGNYGAGLLAGTSRIIGRIAQARGVALEGVRPRRPVQRTGDAGFPLWLIIVVFVLIVLISRSGGGPGRRTSWGRRRGWSGWSSGVGPFGGGWSSGGGGFGGGFGGFGGGRSGGGGASGSW